MSLSPQGFPEHGRIACTFRFAKPGETIKAGVWRFRNDAGHWGSSNPKILVLCFSKGKTQADACDRQQFEDVAFPGARRRFATVLQALGLVNEDEDINARFGADEKDFAFALLLSCSTAWLCQLDLAPPN